MRRRIESEILIAAAPERVWALLTDFGSYPFWSRFLTSLEGAIEAGERLAVCIETRSGRRYRFRPVVLQVTPPRALRWLGRLGVAGLLDGEQGFFLEAAPAGGTRLRQTGSFQGLLLPFFWRRIAFEIEAGFDAFARALKARAEDRPEAEGGRVAGGNLG